jgi:2-C-methyl-D-erythritol 4-phosphate cytidylyltransferase
MLAEWVGIPVQVVPGSYTNLKITTPEDLAWASFLLSRKETEQ